MAASRSSQAIRFRPKLISSLLWTLAVFLGPLGLSYATLPLTRAGQGKSAEHRHGHQRQERANEHHQEDHGRQSLTFGSGDIQLVRAYYASHHQGLPPGLAKRGGDLPPGLEKHLERNGTLPPGLQKRLSPFPDALERELPALPGDCYCRRGVLGSNVLIWNTRTGRIVDIVRGAIAP